MANSNKLQRTNDDIRFVLSRLLPQVKDPRVSGAFISITGAEVTPDLKYAKIFFSALGVTDAEKKKEIAKGLKSSAGFIRRQIAQKLNLRITPELSFVEDTSIKYGAHISELLNGITFSDDEEENTEDGENGDE